MRAEVCSGPWPSWPCGSIRVEPAQQAPLLLGRDDELVDHDLRAVGEVAELRLPDHQGVGAGRGEAVLEAQRGLLGEDGVDDGEARLPVRDVLERDVLVAVALVEQHGVAMEEGAAPGVLPGQAHRDSPASTRLA